MPGFVAIHWEERGASHSWKHLQIPGLRVVTALLFSEPTFHTMEHLEKKTKNKPSAECEPGKQQDSGNPLYRWV